MYNWSEVTIGISTVAEVFFTAIDDPVVVVISNLNRILATLCVLDTGL